MDFLQEKNRSYPSLVFKEIIHPLFKILNKRDAKRKIIANPR
jgi:hypothetical protein